VDGTVTLSGGEFDTDNQWRLLRKRLSQDGAPLIYVGNGFGKLNVNVPGSAIFDVKWGPIPKILDFQPLGPGRSAVIRWQVTPCIPELKFQNAISPRNPPPAISPGLAGGRILNNLGPASTGPVCQFNYGATITYNEDGYATQSIKG